MWFWQAVVSFWGLGTAMYFSDLSRLSTIVCCDYFAGNTFKFVHEDIFGAVRQLLASSPTSPAVDAATASLAAFISSHSVRVADSRDLARDRKKKQIGSTLSELGLIVPYDKSTWRCG